MVGSAISSIADLYYVRLLDTSGTQIALFDNWIGLSYVRAKNDVGSYTLTLDANDTRHSLFQTDCIVEVYRSIPGCGVSWYKDFEGFHRKEHFKLQSNGTYEFTSEGVTFEDLLTRTVINYKAGTIYADKVAPTQTVMLQFAYENCGAGATLANGRLTHGVLPNFTVGPDSGYGLVWEGSRAFENLLDIEKELAGYGHLDFAVVSPAPANFEFLTYPLSMGEDRTVTGLNGATGLNGVGLVPVILSAQRGTLQEEEATLDRMKEGNVVMVLGKGEGTLREVYPNANLSGVAASPWNRCEIARPSGDQEFESQFNALGQEILTEMAAKRSFTCIAMQQPSCLYGVQYKLGTKLTCVLANGLQVNMQVTKVTVDVSASGKKLSIELTEVP